MVDRLSIDSDEIPSEVRRDFRRIKVLQNELGQPQLRYANEIIWIGGVVFAFGFMAPFFFNGNWSLHFAIGFLCVFFGFIWKKRAESLFKEIDELTLAWQKNGWDLGWGIYEDSVERVSSSAE